MIGEFLRGVPASPGIALGTAFIIDTGDAVAAPNSVSGPATAAAEKAHWSAARDSVVEALNQLAERARSKVGAAEAGIFEAQALMAGDPGLQEQVDSAIDAGQSAEAASQHAIDGFAALFADIEDAYLRQRGNDVREVGRALSRALAGRAPVPLTDLPPGAVVCAAELGAGTLLMLDRASIVALVLGSGGATSHVAILARTFGIPTVLGIGDLSAIVSGMLLAVDGTSGEVQLSPEGTRLTELQDQIEAQAAERTSLARLRGEPATTPDGFRLDLWANIGNPSDVAPALEQGAEGVGLFRTEFLIAGRETLPTENEQFSVYRQVLDDMSGRPVVIRTFDIGGDKPVPALHLPPEANPFLGFRAIRIGLHQPELLATQLRAIVRAAEGGRPAWIMLPMVSSVEQVRQVRGILRGVCPDGVPAHLRLGIMVEIPSAALVAPALAKEVDFFSVGTNDLTQYTLAVDRGQDRIAALYQPFHPAVLRLIGLTAQAAAAANIPCGVCGEMAADVRATAVLLGLGITELSMSASALGYVKREVRAMSLSAARELADEVITLPAQSDVLTRIEAFRAAQLPPLAARES